MSKRERAGAKGRGGRPNLPPHVEAAAPTVETPENGADIQRREEQLASLGAKPMRHPLARISYERSRIACCPRCKSVSLLQRKTIVDDDRAGRQVWWRCRRCLFGTRDEDDFNEYQRATD